MTPSSNPINGCGAQWNAVGDLQQFPAFFPARWGNTPLFTFDMTIGYAVKPIRSWESFSIEPQVSIFNLFNRANFNDGSSLQTETWTAKSGSVGATTPFDRRTGNLGADRAGLGRVLFRLGAHGRVRGQG